MGAFEFDYQNIKEVAKPWQKVNSNLYLLNLSLSNHLDGSWGSGVETTEVPG